MRKIKVAFIKYNGLSVGGTELWHQKIAVNLPKDKFDVDFYYCDSAPFIGSDYKQGNTNVDRLDYLRKNKVNLIKFDIEAVDIRLPYNPWISTNFWKVFEPEKYDLIQTSKAGAREYPFYLIDLPVVEIVSLVSRPDKSKNIAWSFHPSNWQRDVWLNKGGNKDRSSILPAPIDQPLTSENYRKELNIPDDAIVAGFHQRPDDNIWSPIPLNSFRECQRENWHFVIKGGSDLYKKQADDLKLKNIHFLPPDGNNTTVSKFLNTIDFMAHGRKDGETFGNVLAEAIVHGKPCLSHYSEIANAQEETIGKAGLFALNQKDYTDKLGLLFSDKKLRDDLSIRAKERGKEYGIENTIKTLIPVYEEILKDPSRFENKITIFSRVYDLFFSYAVFIYRKIKKIIRK